MTETFVGMLSLVDESKLAGSQQYCRRITCESICNIRNRMIDLMYYNYSFRHSSSFSSDFIMDGDDGPEEYGK